MDFAPEEERLILSKPVVQFLFIYGMLRGYFEQKLVINQSGICFHESRMYFVPDEERFLLSKLVV